MASTSESMTLQLVRDAIVRPSIGQRVLAYWYLWERWQERARQRRALLGLDDHLLRDIGISRAEAEREGRKPLWVD